MKEITTATSFSWIRYVKIFLLAVFLIFVSAIAIRTVFAIQKASFTSNYFNVLLTCKNSYLIGIDKNSKRLSVEDVGNIREQLIGKNKFQIGVLLHIPVNAQLVYKKGSICPIVDQDFLSFDHIYQLAANPEVTYKSINRYDLLKLYFAAKSIPEDSRISRVISIDSADLDNQMTELFQDSKVHERASTIEIINATSINGLGQQVSQMLQNGGYNVISVKSESSTDANSSISIGNNVSRKEAASLMSALDLPIVQNDSLSVSDLRINLEPDLEAGFSE